MPVLMALLSIIVGLGIATIVAQEFSLSVFVVNMMTGMGLALGIDYSLFITSRFREERGGGLDKHAAIAMTGATASRAVLFSGSTFVIALCGLFLVPTNVLRSLAAGAVIVGFVSVIAALTLLPAMLSLLGDRINAGRIPLVGTKAGQADAGEARVWRAVINQVMRRPLASLVVAGAAMILLAIPVLGLHIGQSGVATLPNSLPSKQGYLAIAAHFPDQDPYPVEIAVAGATPTDRADLTKLEATLAGDPRFGPGRVQASPDGTVLALAVPIRGDAVSSADVHAVDDLRQHLVPGVFAGSDATVLVGGKTAETADYFHAVSAPTPYVLLFVLGLSFLLLMLAFRSLVIAAVSILLNLLSVGAASGLITLVFIHGYTAGFFGFQKVTAIDAWVPLFLFSVLFALSMDYQVFLMSRIKERYDHTGNTKEAVAGGVASTARIITGAALIIVVVFTGFARGLLRSASRISSRMLLTSPFFAFSNSASESVPLFCITSLAACRWSRSVHASPSASAALGSGASPPALHPRFLLTPGSRRSSLIDPSFPAIPSRFPAPAEEKHAPGPHRKGSTNVFVRWIAQSGGIGLLFSSAGPRDPRR